MTSTVGSRGPDWRRRGAPFLLAISLALSSACGDAPRRIALPPALGGGHEPSDAQAALQQRIGAALEQREATYGVVVEHLGRGDRFVRNHERRFAAGSVYKIGVAYEVLRQVEGRRLSLKDSLTIEPEDALEPEPEGGLAVGEEVTVAEALRSMMSVSSNAAAFALMRTVGRAQLNASLASLGLRHTGVPLLDTSPGSREARAKSPSIAVTTPADMAGLLVLLARESLLDKSSRAELRRLLALEEPLDPLAESFPPQVQVLSKTGNLEDASNVAGLVVTPRGEVVVTVFSEGADPGDARMVIRDIAAAIGELYLR